MTLIDLDVSVDDELCDFDQSVSDSEVGSPGLDLYHLADKDIDWESDADRMLARLMDRETFDAEAVDAIAAS